MSLVLGWLGRTGSLNWTIPPSANLTLRNFGLMRMPYDEALGVVAGVTGNPAILAYAADSVPTNKPELGYAIVFPTSTVIKIMAVQVLLVLFSKG